MGAGPRRSSRDTHAPRRNATESARVKYERYLGLAKEAARVGDTIEMEQCYQHAEHYFRVMRGDG
jgi:hypothetical protein